MPANRSIIDPYIGVACLRSQRRTEISERIRMHGTHYTNLPDNE